mgnify:CR=1 FL=1
MYKALWSIQPAAVILQKDSASCCYSAAADDTMRLYCIYICEAFCPIFRSRSHAPAPVPAASVNSAARHDVDCSFDNVQTHSCAHKH